MTGIPTAGSTPTEPPPRAGRRAGADVHVRFIAASLLFGGLGGLTLAISLPLQAALGSIDASWVAHAQVHGHAQVIGFAGLFVVGVAFHLVPRFAGRRELSAPWAVSWVFWLLTLGVLARMLGQPLAEHRAFALLAIGGLAAELAGASLYLLVIGRTMSTAVRAMQHSAILITGSAVGLVLQALLGLWWLGGTLLDGRMLLAAAETRTLVHLQFFAFLLPVILGVGLRSFPTFFARPTPSPAAGRWVALLVLGGALLWATGSGIETQAGADGRWLTLAGQGLTGAGVLTAIVAFGPWRRASRLAAASRGLAWAIHPALLWLAATGVLLAGSAAQAMLTGGVVSNSTLDAVRHVFAVGVVMLAILGMAQLILPEFASERLVRAVGGWRGPFFGVTVSVATALRGIVPLLGVDGDVRWWLMAVAGVLAWMALVVFAFLAWRASRSHRAYMQRIQRFQRDALPMAEAAD